MTATISVTTLLFSAALTPGPNNFIVLEAGAGRGLFAAGRAIVGVLLGSLVLLTLVWSGLGAAMAHAPWLPKVLSLLGGLYLGCLGTSLWIKAGRASQASQKLSLPSTLLGVACFQLLNPKAWLLVSTAAAAMAEGSHFTVLAALVIVITSLCLSLWVAAGRALSTMLANRSHRLWFDQIMGALLALSATGLIADAFI